MKCEIQIREANKADLPNIVELWKSIMDFHQNIDSFFTRSQDGHRNFLDWVTKEMESENANIFVAESEGMVIGYIKIGIIDYPPVFEKKRCGMISGAFVRESHRRHGIGEALYNRTMEWFKEKEIARVELRVAIANPVAQGFWKKMGFRPYMTTMFKDE
mgnify:CR=1 FL=1